MKGYVYIILAVILIIAAISIWSIQFNNSEQGMKDAPVEQNSQVNEAGIPSTNSNEELPAQDASNTAASTSNPTSMDIVIKDYAFSPKTLTVSKGTTVTWTNEDGVAHTATSDNGVFDSGLISYGESYSYTFTESGTYAYYCKPHPGMKASITVE